MNEPKHITLQIQITKAAGVPGSKRSMQNDMFGEGTSGPFSFEGTFTSASTSARSRRTGAYRRAMGRDIDQKCVRQDVQGGPAFLSLSLQTFKLVLLFAKLAASPIIQSSGCLYLPLAVMGATDAAVCHGEKHMTLQSVMVKST